MNCHSADIATRDISHGAATPCAQRRAQDLSRIIDARSRRKQFFQTHLFSDPAWDILLTLALAELTQQRVTVSELCGAAGAPYSTAQRYIQAMMDEGLVVGHHDRLDARRKFMSLSPQTSKQILAYLDSSVLPELKAA